MAERRKRRTLLWVVGAAIPLTCLCVIVAIASSPSTEEDTESPPSAQPTEPQESEAEPAPTEGAPIQEPPAATEVPTAPPAPTATPRPIAPAFLEIRGNVQSMTEAQWKAYLPTLDGYAVVNWTGWVEDVNVKFGGGYELWVDMDPTSEAMSIYDVVFDIPDDIALLLNRDQQVTFSGTIDHVSELFGSITVYLVDPALQ